MQCLGLCSGQGADIALSLLGHYLLGASINWQRGADHALERLAGSGFAVYFGH